MGSGLLGDSGHPKKVRVDAVMVTKVKINFKAFMEGALSRNNAIGHN